MLLNTSATYEAIMAREDPPVVPETELDRFRIQKKGRSEERPQGCQEFTFFSLPSLSKTRRTVTLASFGCGT